MILPVEQFLTLFCLHGSPDPTFESRAKMNGSTLFIGQVDSLLGRWGQTKQVSNEVEKLIIENAENHSNDACFVVAVQRIGARRVVSTR